MSKIISEENPAAQQSAQQSTAPQGQGAGGAQDKVRKQARQLAYDVRYKVKQGFKDGQKTDPASLKRAFLSQLGKSPAPGPVKQLAKKMLIGEAYDFVDINETLTKSISSAVGKVFVKTIEVDDADGNPAFEITDLVVKEDLGERKYKVRVTDKKSGKSYTRMATRPKISELRKNPNISSVEMTGYGTPYEGEKNKGSQTADVKSGKGLAKKDYDGDGKVESPSAEYKGSKDKAIKKALHREEFIDEVNTEDANPQANTKRIDVMKGKNKIKINPNMGEQTEMGTDKPQEDPREKRIRLIKRQILQKKQQAVRTGAGTDVQASHTPEGDVISEKQKDTPDQVKAVIAFDKARKGTDDATYDSEHGKKKQAKKERDYAKFQRDQGAEDAQKSGHPWEHAKGSTREKEGKKSEKHAHIKDDKDWGYDKKGNSLNPVDIEKKKRKDDGLFGSPNAKKKVKEDYENEPPIKDQTDKQLASVTFDGGGPDGGATITGTGDPREIPTFVTLIKQKLRARGILVSHHVPEGEVVSEKKAAKDYDGDGEVESGKDEYFGSKDKAIKKAMGKKHDCASKVKHEEYGLGDCVQGMHDLDESGNVAHYDVLFEHGVEKDVDVSSLEILEYKMHEHVIRDGEVVAEQEYDNTKSPDYAKKKKALAKKHGGADKVKGHPQYESSVQSALDALNMIEGKKKGLDGKECWDGYKLAGTKKKGGKTVDNCVKVKEDAQYEDDKPVKDQTNKQVASVTFDGGGTDGGATIQGSGDNREIPTFVNLIMNKLRARGMK